MPKTEESNRSRISNYSGFMDYMAGLIAGDGSITLMKGRARIRIFDSSKQFLEDIKRKLSKMGIHGTVYWEGSTWCLSLYSTSLWSEIKDRLVNPIDKVEWLKGFVDAEGSIYIWVKKPSGRKYCQVAITNTNIRFILLASTILDELGVAYRIKVTRDQWKPRWRILISRREAVKKFIYTIGFRHPVRARKAQLCLES